MVFYDANNGRVVDNNPAVAVVTIDREKDVVRPTKKLPGANAILREFFPSALVIKISAIYLATRRDAM